MRRGFALAFILTACASLGGAPRTSPASPPDAATSFPPVPAPADPPATLVARAEALAAAGNTAAALQAFRAYLDLRGPLDREKAYAERRVAQLGGVALEVAREKVLIAGDPHRMGLLMPLSGRDQGLGDRVIRAAQLALGAGGPSSHGATFDIVVRDATPTGGSPDRPATELMEEHQVLGLVGTADHGTGARAAHERVPLLALDSEVASDATTTFAILHGLAERSARLAQWVLKLGIRNVAILAPTNASGKRAADAVAAAVAAAGGRVTAHATYPATATSFGPAIAKIAKANFDALFVAETADRLELVAPALAAADIWPGSTPSDGVPRSTASRHEVVLLSTASGLSARLLKAAGRYLQGTVLAPGFVEDADDLRSQQFSARHRALFEGQPPGVTEAYVHDAFAVLRAATERGARTRAELLNLLQTQAFDGVTGAVRFGPDHRRSDPPSLYIVDGERFRAIR